MDKYFKQNKAHWDEITPVHMNSAFYDVAGFKAGKNRLRMPFEAEEMGDMHSKTLLHLQCHFGMDTLTWARAGAKVTGVDFSGEAIKAACKLAKEIGIEARFIESDIYALPDVLKEQFDIVYTGGGAIYWLPDLKKWGEIIARFLRPGGFFYIMEGHPTLNMFYNSPEAKELKIRYSYFHNDDWLDEPPGADYADPAFTSKHNTSGWTHTMGDIINALVHAGLKIEFLHERPVLFHQGLPFMIKDEDGFWRLEGDKLPLTFSIKATKV